MIYQSSYYLLTIFSIDRLILDNRDKLGSIGYKKLSELNFGTSPVVVAYPDLSTFETLKVMSDKYISAVAVVGKGGKILGNFGYSEMR